MIQAPASRYHNDDVATRWQHQQSHIELHDNVYTLGQFFPNLKSSRLLHNVSKCNSKKKKKMITWKAGNTAVIFALCISSLLSHYAELRYG